jgi:hypothetical protein
MFLVEISPKDRLTLEDFPNGKCCEATVKEKVLANVFMNKGLKVAVLKWVESSSVENTKVAVLAKNINPELNEPA